VIIRDDSTGINQGEGTPIVAAFASDPVACNAGFVSDNRSALSVNCVKKSGLADVRPPDDDDRRYSIHVKVYYPIFVDLTAKTVIVIGAGKVGMRKIRALVEAGARVKAVSPESAEALPEGVEWLQRDYRSGDLAGAFLAYAATNVREVNAEVGAEGRAAGIPVNVADAPEECDFIVPARLHHQDLQIAVSTGGTKPGRAAAIRDRLKQFLSEALP
jgi:precorrin-2 dehydrogenase / sirohydrochlorin ferrochelatase